MRFGSAKRDFVFAKPRFDVYLLLQFLHVAINQRKIENIKFKINNLKYMFDDEQSQNKEPEDIFAGPGKSSGFLEAPAQKEETGIPANLPAGLPGLQETAVETPKPVLAPDGVMAKTETIKPPASEKDIVVVEEPKRSWMRLMVIAGAGVLILGVGAWVILQSRIRSVETPAAEEKQQETQAPEETAPAVPETSEVTAPADTDGDGLTDTEEYNLGTDIIMADSDNDGLLDRDEVRIYQTDPLDPDTDKDGYLDGEEVQNGYDPKGKGKLFEVPLPGGAAGGQ